MAANRVMKSVTNWLERKLRLKVSATKTKVVRPTKSNFLGFTFWKSKDGWKCKPANDRKKRLYAKTRAILCRRKAVARPMKSTFEQLNWLIRGWINYYGKFRISMLNPIFQLLRRRLVQWVRQRYKRYKTSVNRAYEWLGRIRKQFPTLFYQWRLGFY